ncbi:MAG: RNA polymerase sigma factor [Bacteroidota bacterium]
MANLSDEELMQLILKGDLDKMRYLFDRYQVRIFNYCLQLTKNRELSKDLTQEVFYKVLKFRRTYKNTRFSSWVYSIARNLCYDYHKQQKRQEKQIDDLKHFKQRLDSDSESLGDAQLLNHALNQLSLADRELIVMSKYQGMKYQEIAEITNSTAGAVRTKTHRALHKLKNLYFTKSKKHEL